MNEYEKEIFQWLEDAGLNPVHHNMAVPHLEVKDYMEQRIEGAGKLYETLRETP